MNWTPSSLALSESQAALHEYWSSRASLSLPATSLFNLIKTSILCALWQLTFETDKIRISVFVVQVRAKRSLPVPNNTALESFSKTFARPSRGKKERKFRSQRNVILCQLCRLKDWLDNGIRRTRILSGQAPWQQLHWHPQQDSRRESLVHSGKSMWLFRGNYNNIEYFRTYAE